MDPIYITASFGVCQNLKNEDSHSLLKRVDEALYKAKEQGRNSLIGG
jgi:PleD family two-component response regulator